MPATTAGLDPCPPYDYANRAYEANGDELNYAKQADEDYEVPKAQAASSMYETIDDYESPFNHPA